MNNPLFRPLVISTFVRFFISAFIFVSIIVTTFYLLNNQLKASMKHSTDELAHQILVKTENILNQSEQIYLSLERYLGQPCTPNIIKEMQNTVAEGLYLRDASFFSSGKIYCSSAPEIMGMPIRSADKFIEKRMLLFTDLFITKGIPLFAVRMDRNDDGIVSIIDGRYLQNVLDTNNSKSKLVSYIKVGDGWIEESGGVHHAALPGLDFMTTLKANSMPVYVIVGLKSMPLWARLWSMYWLTITSVLLANTLLCLFVYQILSRPRSVSTILNEALQRNEFVPYLQGVVDSQGNLCGAEALMRWQISSDNVIGPNIFIEAAEKSDLIVAMTSRMLTILQDYFIQQKDLLPKDFILSVNVSKAYFTDMRLANDCHNFLNVFPDNNLTLCLEITERELIAQTELTRELLKRLNEIGVKIAIDDFGTGHASFSYLQNFKVDFIKIDRAFIDSIGTESVSASLVDIIIDMGKKLGIQVVAEGVETQLQSQYLIEQDVAKLQGFYYHRPVSLEAFTDTLKCCRKFESGA